MSLNTTLFGCLMRIYDDIISVWNLNDPEESLASVDFNTKMFNLIKPLLQKPEQPPRDIAEKTNELADLAARIRPGLEKAVAYAGLAGVAASILIDRIRATPVTALCLGAYVVDLTLILHRLFLTNSPPRAVSKELVLETFRVYQESCAEVHDRIRKIAYSATFRPKEFSKEIEALIKTELKM
ncbi:hypothetical protein K435DRAFT_62175 [Dendrothele bispora CBS 962.96]|uniref:Uncharacterized protein n=1 Tax=Dendrothele bispora (strain CBS 962.96) TaxID=1314807 RepID=A0A4S8MRW8_DENBC|nr:hypothetical protein K435DRAFT_62175 [Dendrothele bispora CBS 962.96]